MAAMVGAPVRPEEPPITNTLPELNLVDSGVRRGISSSTPGRIRPISGSAGAPDGIPMSITSTAPAWALPGWIHRPGFARWNVAVATARTAGPATAPVDASTPDGTSAAITGAPAALIASMTPAAGSRGAPVVPVPSSASTIACAPSSRLGLERLRRLAGEPVEHLGGVALERLHPPDGQDVDLATGLAEHASGHQAVPAVVPLAADDRDPARGRPAGDHMGKPLPRALHQVERGHLALLDRPAVGRAHLLRRREGLEPPHVRTATAAAMPVLVGERHAHALARARPPGRPRRR